MSKSKELYVGKISQNAGEEDIRKLFSIVGTVTSIHLITDAQTGEFKGCGYVRMATAEQTKAAIVDLDGALLIDKVITVSEARPQAPQQKKHPFGGDRRKPSAGPRPPRGKK